MTTFLALYRGDTILGSELVAVSADRKLVRDFAERMIQDEPIGETREPADQVHRNGDAPPRKGGTLT